MVVDYDEQHRAQSPTGKSSVSGAMSRTEPTIKRYRSFAPDLSKNPDLDLLQNSSSLVTSHLTRANL